MRSAQIVRLVVVITFGLCSVQLLPWPLWLLVNLAWVLGMVTIMTVDFEYVHKLDKLLKELSDNMAEQTALMEQKSRSSNKKR